MATIVEQIEALDLAAIDDALGRVQSALSAEGGVDLTGLDLTGLLGEVSPAIEAVRNLDGGAGSFEGIVSSALGDLAELVDFPGAEGLTEVIEGIEELATLISGLVEVLDPSDGAALVDRLMTGVGGSLDLSGFVSDIAGRTADALKVEIPEPLSVSLQQLASLGRTPSPEVLANTLLGTLTGLDFARSHELVTGLSTSVEIAVAAGDSTALATAFGEIEARLALVLELSGRAEAGGADLDDFIEAIEALTESLDNVIAIQLPRFVEGFATDLRTSRNLLQEVGPLAAIDDLLDAIPSPGLEPMDMVVQPLRDLAGGLDAVTSESITAAMEAARSELTSFVRTGELAALLDGVDDAQRRVIELIRRLPAEELRENVVHSLRRTQREILSFRGFDLLDEVLGPVRALSVALAELDTSTVQDAVSTVVDEVNDVFADFPIEELRDAIDAVVEPLGAILDEAGPVLAEVTAQLESLVAEIESIDFDGAGAEVVEKLAEIRGQVTDALGTDTVPDALKAVIAGAAATLKQMDLSLELSDPFQDAVARLEIDELLAPITELWDQLGAVLTRATPTALVAELDPPFEELLARLDDVSLEPLTESLSSLFAGVRDVLLRADPRELLAPLDSEFDQITATIRASLDPAPIFAPLREAYDALQSELAAFDIESAVQAMLGGVSDAPKMLTEAVEGELRQQGGGGAELSGPEDQPFRFGDIVRPLAGFVAEIRSSLHGLTDEVAVEGLVLLADTTRTLRALIDPATGYAIRIADGVDARRGWFDAEVAGPYASLRAQLAGLDGAVALLTIDGDARARVDAAHGGVTFEARFSLDASVVADGKAAAETTRTAASPPGLGRSVRLLVREVDRLLPAELLDGSMDPAAAPSLFIDALIDPFDPTPLVDELDALGTQIMEKLAEFVDELSIGLLALWEEVVAGLQPLMPNSVAGRIQQVITAVADELGALDPAVIEDEVRNVVDATVGLLDLYSPARLAAELGTVFDGAIAMVDTLDPAALLGDLDPFAELRADLASLRPSVILAPLVSRAESLTEALEVIAAIDLDIAGELVARLVAAFDQVLEAVEREWQALLDDLESMSGGSVSIEVSGGA